MRRLLALLLPLFLALLTGCATGRVAQDRAAALQSWAAVRPLAPPDAPPTVWWVGITVHDFPSSADLRAWRHSRQLLGKVAQRWLGLPAAQVLHLENPTAAMLDQFFDHTLPDKLRPQDSVVIYLGTHQFSDGRIMLAGGESVNATRVARWLAALPQQQVLLADICFGERLENTQLMPARVCRIYASGAAAEATEVLLNGREPEASAFFAGTLAVIKADCPPQENRYSLLGLLWVHALRLELTEHPATAPDARTVYRRLATEYGRLVAAAPDLDLPVPTAAGLRAIPLGAATRPAAQHAGDLPAGDPAPTTAAPATAPEADWIALTAQLGEHPSAPLSLSHANLLLSKLNDPAVDPAKLDASAVTLDAMAAVLQKRLAGITDPRQQAAVLATYFYTELGITAEKLPYHEDFLLHTLLQTRHSRCGGLTALYLGVAERLPLPLVAVCLPEHVFVRWPGVPAADQSLNLETTLQGVVLSDAEYRKARPWPSTPAADAFYLMPLTPRQTLALWVSALSSSLTAQGRFAEARRAALLASGVNPTDAEAWNNLGIAEHRLGRDDAAKVAYDHALAINPELAEGWNNLAGTLPQVADRIPLYKKAVQYKPGLGEAWRNLAYAYFETQQYELAWAACERCRELGQPIPETYLKALREHLPKSVLR